MPADAEQIDALLPQTQCTRCGYTGCMPYAEALAAGLADINQCPPGGAATIAALAELLDVPAKPLNPANGAQSPLRVAWIDEARCIGCAKCLAPCPVDAIVGAQKLMHTVIRALCTGCELCLPPCPVDCIEMRPVPADFVAPAPDINRLRYHAHIARDAHRRGLRQREIDAKKAAVSRGLSPPPKAPL